MVHSLALGYNVDRYELGGRVYGVAGFLSNPIALFIAFVQLTYLPLLAANQPALSSTLVDWLSAHRANLEQNAAPFSFDSMTIGGAVSPDLFTNPGVAAPPSTVGCLPWLAHMTWLHARMVSNDTLMRVDVYPLLRGAIK